MVLLVAAVCFGAVRLGGAFNQAPGPVSPFWPLAGVAMALLLRVGPGIWPGVWLGSALGLLTMPAAPGLAAAIAAGDTLGLVLAARWLLRNGFNPRLEQTRDLWRFTGAAAGAAAVLSSAWAVAALVLSGSLDPVNLPQAWVVRWAGETLGLFALGVPLLTLDRRSLAQSLGDHRWLSNLPLMAAALASGAAAMALLIDRSGLLLSPIVFLPHVLLCWLALRGGLALAASAVLALLAGSVALALLPGLPDAALQPPWAYLASLLAIVILLHALNGDLARTEARWQLALGGAGLGVAEWPLHRGAGYSSQRWRTLHADPGGTQTATLAAWLTRVHPDQRAALQLEIDALQQAGHDSLSQQLQLRVGEQWQWMELRLVVAERDSAQAPARLVATVSDVQARRSADERQRLSSSLFQNLHEGLLVVDADLRTLDANPTFCALLDTPREALLGSVPTLLRSASADPATRQRQAAMWASLRVAGSWTGEITDRRPSGDPVVLRTTVFTVPDAQGAPRYHVLMVSDVTLQRQQRERLERQAHFDELTQLPNRARLAKLLTEAMAATDREGQMLTVCYLDLDHFKSLNDVFGHDVGDQVLVQLAQRLRGALRSRASWSDVVARLGGDEFVLLLRANTLEEARMAVERVMRVVGEPMALAPGAAPITLSASVGATVYPMDRSDADTLLRHADHAMYTAKQSGRDGHVFFDLEHNRRNEERVMALGRFQEALDRDELVLHYQPKVDLRRGQVLGFEALLRWNHPERGMLAPAHFLPLIEHTGLSARVGDWVMAQALEQLDRWRTEGLDVSVSVNVSARHLQEPDFAQRLGELLARHSAPLGGFLELEVLETAALADIGFTSALLERCAVLGVRFALDDFGTGYSTLTYLKRLPVQVLKIDRSFVHNMLDDPQDRAIVEGVLSLARTFGCVAVAEGVETPAQARALLDLGCDIGQGSGIAPAMPAADAGRFVREWRGLFALAAAPGAGVAVLPLRTAQAQAERDASGIE
ncbi:PAS domain S-box/diguanylate cyclase (GGDEF) domain-containing protein [Burkholderiales bacterium JOSHI_001]|nr:PAS domain S-box/diguanylate cyclase (GGDEF) domain-containing protein [Burkholderiales bacterium JOSHI_001]